MVCSNFLPFAIEEGNYLISQYFEGALFLRNRNEFIAKWHMHKYAVNELPYYS